MSFKVTVTDENGDVVDEIKADCLVGAVHAEGSEDFQGLFYSGCDVLTAFHTLRTAMQVIEEHLSDDGIAQAAEQDDTQIVEDKPKRRVN